MCLYYRLLDATFPDSNKINFVPIFFRAVNNIEIVISATKYARDTNFDEQLFAESATKKYLLRRKHERVVAEHYRRVRK